MEMIHYIAIEMRFKIAGASTIGYIGIPQASPVKTNKIRVNLQDAEARPVISHVEVY